MTQPNAPLLEPRLTLLTIGVADLAGMRAFYERILGWTPVAVNADIVFYKLHGMLLSFFGDAALAADARLAVDPARVAGAQTSRGFTLAHNVPAEADVDALFAALRAKGVRILKEPERTFFGAYGGHFADVEGNVWEVASNPFIPLDTSRDPVTHADITSLMR